MFKVFLGPLLSLSNLENEVENKKAQIVNLQQHLSAREKDIKQNEELLKRCQLHYKELKVKTNSLFVNLLQNFKNIVIHFKQQFSDTWASTLFYHLKQAFIYLCCIYHLYF